MNPATSIKAVLSPADAVREVLLHVAGSVVLASSPAFLLIQFANDVHSILRRHGFQRLFENTYVSGSATGAARVELISQYFDWLGTSYTGEINLTQNVACYERLLLESSYSQYTKFDEILDFGCGPGTVLRTSVSSQTDRLIGFDFAERMRQLAAGAGLDVLSTEEFWNGRANVDCVLSSYVMHYGAVSAHAMAAVCRNMKIGAHWAMNFHKNIGLSEFRMLALENTMLTEVRCVPDTPFGTILVMRRRGD